MKHKGNTDKGLTFHIYDVNLTVIKQRLGRALDSEFDEYSIGRTEYINSINLYIENFCEKRGLDILAVSALIVKPNDDEYGLSLALHLSWCATSSIRLILDQLNIDYPKDKLSFTDLLRNHICPLIISSCPNKSKDDRVYQVINWIEKKEVEKAAQEEITRVLKAQQLREARERSINRSREVTERVKLQKEKEELEAKKNEEAKKRTISESKGRLRWVNNEKARSISKQVKLKGLTNTPMAFFNAIDKGKRTKWSGKPIILAWLIHEMLFLNPPPIKCEVTKGAYKAATELFDYGQSSDSKDRLSEKASRVFSAGEQNYLEIRELVNRILKLNGE